MFPFFPESQQTPAKFKVSNASLLLIQAPIRGPGVDADTSNKSTIRARWTGRVRRVRRARRPRYTGCEGLG
jgi:hypothetical protein